MARDEAPERHHFKIGEVAEIVGVKAHVLRYWEQEFPALRPKKTRGSHRHYSRQNLELAQFIRRLVVDEGYSVAGARRRIAESRTVADCGVHGPETDPRAALREDLLAVRLALVSLLDLLDEADASRGGPADATDEEDVVVAAAAPSRAGTPSGTVRGRRA